MPVVAKLDEPGKPAWIALMIGFSHLVASWSCHLGIYRRERTNEFRRKHDALVRRGGPDAFCRDLVAAVAAPEWQSRF